MPKLSAVPNPKLHIYKAKRYLVKTLEMNEEDSVSEFNTLSDIAKYYHLTLSKVHNIIKNQLETTVVVDNQPAMKIIVEDSKAKFEIVFEDKSCKCCKSIKDIKELTNLSSKAINEIIKRDNPSLEEEEPQEKPQKCTPETCNCLIGCEITSAKYNGDVDESE